MVLILKAAWFQTINDRFFALYDNLFFCLFEASGMKVSLLILSKFYLVQHIVVIVIKEEKCRVSLKNYMCTFCTVIHKFAEKQ
jgi:hypothetical protein